MLTINKTLDFKYVHPYDTLLWITNIDVSKKEGFEGWSASFKLNDDGIVKASVKSIYKAIDLLTGELFDDLIREKRYIQSIRNSNDTNKKAYHEGIAEGIKIGIQMQFGQHIWILACRIYENMTAIDRKEL